MPAAPRAAEDAKAVMALETELAKIQWTQVESRDAVKTYNKYPVTKLVAECPGFDWMAWAKPQGIDKAPEWVIGAAVVLQGLRGDGADDAARHLEGLDGGAAHHAARAVPQQAVRTTRDSSSSARR